MDPKDYPFAIGVPPINSKEELYGFLRDRLGFCGNAAADEAFALLRDTLRFARDYKRSFVGSEGHDGCAAAYRGMQTRLQFDRFPGLATWYLYFLNHHDLIEHASNVTDCWIAPTGEYVLDAIEEYCRDEAQT